MINACFSRSLSDLSWSAELSVDIYRRSLFTGVSVNIVVGKDVSDSTLLGSTVCLLWIVAVDVIVGKTRYFQLNTIFNTHTRICNISY